ncbi:MAG TPA: helix-turn-helix domain-containing protein [Candidatus Gracilibacteria bacterium]|nr:helix-turn-helix domain-containing protein [Candidatus Gracilibacteria bacterium]
MDYYVLDRQQVAEKLNLSTRTIDRYVAKKTFSTRKLNGKIYFHKKEIEDFLLNQNTEAIAISPSIQSTRLRQIQEDFSKQNSPEKLSNSESNFESKDLSNVYPRADFKELLENWSEQWKNVVQVVDLQTKHLTLLQDQLNRIQQNLEQNLALISVSSEQKQEQELLRLIEKRVISASQTQNQQTKEIYRLQNTLYWSRIIGLISLLAVSIFFW